MISTKPFWCLLILYHLLLKLWLSYAAHQFFNSKFVVHQTQHLLTSQFYL
ncbi:unnamed protein product [Musa textilis]